MKKKKKTKKETKQFIFPAQVLAPVKEFLQGELKKLRLRKKTVEADDPFADPSRVSDNAAIDTDAAEQFGHARAEALKKHLDTRIIQIRKALARIKIGRYGICEKCGQFIDTKRLMIRPETTVCINCERKKK